MVVPLGIHPQLQPSCCNDYPQTPQHDMVEESLLTTTMTSAPIRYILPFLLKHESPSMAPTTLGPLLSLPLELRQKIYSYLLPYTNFNNRTYRGGRTLWIPGNINILSASQQIYDECASMLYGENIFECHVGYDSIEFIQLRKLKSGVMPLRTPPFLEFFKERCVKKMRNIVINIQYVDDYTGMIKHNVRLTSALMHGISKQVEKLVAFLLRAEELYNVQINLRSWADTIDTAQTVLNPLNKLTNVRGEIEVFGLPDIDARKRKGYLGPSDVDWRSRKVAFKPGDLNHKIGYTS